MANELYWLEAQKYFHDAAHRQGWACHGFVDARAAGSVTKGNPGDFLIAKNFITFSIEVKSSIKREFPTKNIRSRHSQNDRVMALCNMGLPILYAIYQNKETEGLVYSAPEVLDQVLNKKPLPEAICTTAELASPEDLLQIYVQRFRLVKRVRRRKEDGYENFNFG